MCCELWAKHVRLPRGNVLDRKSNLLHALPSHEVLPKHEAGSRLTMPNWILLAWRQRQLHDLSNRIRVQQHSNWIPFTVLPWADV